jgi:sugar phosphate isomerase/epimerase
MILTRRELGRLVLAGVPSLSALGMSGVMSGLAQAAPRPNSNISYINDVQFGLQPFCYHDLPMNRENRPILIQRMVQNGLGMVELHATWCEPRFSDSGVSAQEAREKLRNWRLTAPKDYYLKIKQEFDDAGIVIFTYYVTFDESDTDAEIDAAYDAAKALGAKGVVGSYGLAVAKRLVPFPGKHGMFAGLHNHDNLSDPDAFSNEASFEKGFAMSPDFKATLDVRHFTAGNGDCLAFLEKHHERTSSIHLGDRRKNNGHSTPFGEGDAPIIQILRMIRDNQWPIVALLEFEHGTLRTGVEEVQIAFDYCKRALA